MYLVHVMTFDDLFILYSEHARHLRKLIVMIAFCHLNHQLYSNIFSEGMIWMIHMIKDGNMCQADNLASIEIYQA